MTTRENTPLRGAKLVAHGRSTEDGRHVAIFEERDQLVEYEVHIGKAPIRPQD